MNRLINETSPYLLQHAHNPVDWYPWSDEALQRSKAEYKPILVSIGYAACHWCHVMERESFESVETAALMNAHFINIKIDREERPDLDAIYMEAVQLIAGNGGWPLNVFLTPDAKPFYGGTYFPPEAAYGRSSWTDVLDSIREAWQQRPQEILSQADNLTAHIGSTNFLSNLKPEEGPFTQQQLNETSVNLLKVADKQWGGFSRAPKFPQTGSILYLLRHAYFQKQYGGQLTEADKDLAEKALQQALLSLDKMIFGGIYDQLAGGFARYATDPHWQIPHFEKMLYDNALLISVFSEAFQFTDKPLYRQVIEQTMQFIETNWISPEGGFYSAYDADSEGVEGKYYTWTKAEIESVGGEEVETFCQYYQVTEEGNWEETNILWCLQSLEDFCQKNNLDFLDTEKQFNRIRQKLLQHRKGRIPPLLDDKILLSWNALMITACCRAYTAIGNEQYLSIAEGAATFIETKMKDTASYYHNYKGKAANPAFLDDLAFYIQSLIRLQEATANQQYLLSAKMILEDVLERFADLESPFFFYTAAGQADIVVRKKEWYDGATPSGNSVMAENLYYLSILFDKPEWKRQATEMIGQLSTAIRKYPSSFTNAGLVMQLLVRGLDEIVINGEETKEALKQLQQLYWPDKLVQTQKVADSSFPLFRNRWPENGKCKIYLCKEQSCQPPVNSIDDLLKMYR